MEGAVWGFIGTIVGALASLATTLVTARNAAALQGRTARMEIDEKRRAFQRDTLLEIQDALHDLMRLITRSHLEDEAAFRETGNWGSTPLSEAVNEGQRLARRKVMILVERVADEPLRRDLKSLNETLTQVLFEEMEEVARVLFHSATAQAMQTMEHIGRVLRAQY